MDGKKTSGTMHMALYWGKDVWVIFADWPGNSVGRYILSLIVTLLAAVLVEFLASYKCGRRSANPFLGGFLKAFVYGFRIFFTYCVMLAVMSFNIGVLLAAVVGHGIGYWLFGTDAFCKKEEEEPQGTSSKDKEPAVDP